MVNYDDDFQAWWSARKPIRDARKTARDARKDVRQAKRDIRQNERELKKTDDIPEYSQLVDKQLQLQANLDAANTRNINAAYNKERAKIESTPARLEAAANIDNALRNNFFEMIEKNIADDTLNPIFYDGISLFARTAGQQEDPRSKYLNAQADLHDRQAARADMTAQQEAGIANRDFRVEADKEAVAQAATKNAQAVQNMSSAAGGGAAALQRQLETAQYDTHRQRQDDTRRKAQDYRDEATNIRQTAIGERSAATDLNTQKAQELEYNEQLRTATQQQRDKINAETDLLNTLKDVVVNRKRDNTMPPEERQANPSLGRGGM